MRKAGFLRSSTLTWTSVGLTWQMVQRTQTIYIEQRVPDRGRSPGFWWIPRGKTRSLAVLAVRSTHNLIEVVAAGGVTASKSMGRCPISAFPEDPNVATRKPYHHVQAAESIRSTLRWDNNPMALILTLSKTSRRDNPLASVNRLLC